MSRKPSSIKTKTLFLSLVMPMILLCLMGAALFYTQYRGIYGAHREQLTGNSRNISAEIALELSQSFELLRNLTVNPLAIRMTERMGERPSGLDDDDYIGLPEAPAVKDLLARVAKGTNASVVYLGSPDSTGIFLGSDLQLPEGFDVRKRDYYQDAMAIPGTTVISQPRVSAEKSAEPIIVITAARALVDDSGRPTGIAALNYSFDPIIKIIRGLMAEYSVNISLFDLRGGYLLWSQLPDGSYFYDPNEVLPMKELLEGFGNGEAVASAAAGDMLAKPETYFEGYAAGGKSMIQTLHVPGTRWGILVSMPMNDVSSMVLASVAPPILTFALVFLLAQIVSFVLQIRMIVNPLVGVGKRLEGLAAADADLTVSVPELTNDEIGALARSFNAFVAKLRVLMGDIKVAIGKTDDINRDVSASTEETSSAIEQINANLTSIGAQIDDLDQNIGETVTAIEQVTRNIDSMDNQIFRQSAMVEESTAAITEMIASLGNVNQVAQNKKKTTEALSSVAEEGQTRIAKTAENFRAVAAHIERVREMAASINNIAAQTNLLSMNAAIEAAHAGDSGRGFAVVAEEIRKLADSAGNSAKTITQTIRDVNAAVVETDRNVASTSEAFASIAAEVRDTLNAFSEIEHAVAELNIGGRQILDSTNEINDVTVSIRSGSSEIKSGTKVMLESSAKIKEVSYRVTGGMAESTSGAQEIMRAMHDMVRQANELRSVVSGLKNDFGQFKTE